MKPIEPGCLAWVIPWRGTGGCEVRVGQRFPNEKLSPSARCRRCNTTAMKASLWYVTGLEGYTSACECSLIRIDGYDATEDAETEQPLEVVHG